MLYKLNGEATIPPPRLLIEEVLTHFIENVVSVQVKGNIGMMW